MHVDEFIESRKTSEYASFFFMLHRMPAVMQMKFEEFLKGYMLFCTYEGKKHRVTGASRMGDIWLTEDFDQDTGYQKRVDVADCSDWSKD